MPHLYKDHAAPITPIATLVDLNTYPRLKLYELFTTYDVPVVSRTIPIDITNLRACIKQNNLRFMPTFSFFVTKAMNEIPEFLHRIENQSLVKFDLVIPSFTVLSEDNILNFAKGVWSDHFSNDYDANLVSIERASRGLDQATHQDGLGEIFITNIPWYSFTSIHHPYSKFTSSIPIISMGKIYQENSREIIPFGIQTHHALLDGYHIGLFMKKLEGFLDNPTQFIF